ncbi:MAG: hypothetical protein RXR36_03855 [Nitrososphaeria archaeon]
MRRSNTIHNIAGKETKAKLKALGKSFVDCWNEVNKLRLEQYKKHEPVDFNFLGLRGRTSSSVSFR